MPCKSSLLFYNHNTQSLPKEFWQKKQSAFFSHQNLPHSLVANLAFFLKEQGLKDMLFVPTSCTTSCQEKWIGLSKSSFLVSADVVNKHLEVTSSDTWLSALSLCHVGGLSIFARAHQANCNAFCFFPQEKPWSAICFHKALKSLQATLTSIVPYQLHLLLEAKLSPPKSLRACVVGGEKVPLSLFQKALQMGWNNLVLTYGSTECSSQIASSPYPPRLTTNKLPALKILPHMEVCAIRDPGKNQDRFGFTSISLFKGSLFCDPGNEKDPWSWKPQTQKLWISEDYGEIYKGELVFKGRSYDFTKLKGKKVALGPLQKKLEKILCDLQIQSSYVAFVAPRPDPVWGSVLTLHTSLPQNQVESLLEQFHKNSSSALHIREVYLWSCGLPLTETAKLSYEKIRRVLEKEATFTQKDATQKDAIRWIQVPSDAF